MTAIIDTSSLISLVRYYLPFDKEDTLKNFFKEQILEKNIIVLDLVEKECEYQGQGQVIDAMPFLKEPKFKTSTSSLVATAKIHRMLDNNFIVGSLKNEYNDAQYDLLKTDFMKSADFGIVLYAMTKSTSKKNKFIVVTEETGVSNDGKPFKKIPEMCKIIEMPSMTLPEFIQQKNLVDISITVKEQITTLF